MAESTPSGAEEAPRLLTLRELAAFLNVPKKTLYYWVSRREIPFLRIGPRHLRFDRGDVLRHFAEARPIPLRRPVVVTRSQGKALVFEKKSGRASPLRKE
jgi:excisionase family DNA binding protein